MSRNFSTPLTIDTSFTQGMVFGGGGGTTTTQNSGLPDWARPYVESSLGDARDIYGVGGFEHVQGFTPEQVASLSKRKQLGGTGGVLDQVASDSYDATSAFRDAAAGQGLFGANALGDQTQALASSIGLAQQQQLGNLAGQFSRRGNLGGARAEQAANVSAQQVGGELAAAELAARRQAALQGAGGAIESGGLLQNQFATGANTLGDVGTDIQQQRQNEGDAAYQGIQRLFGLYNNPALGEKTVATQSGGK